jgi:hypothetical protein
LDIFFVQKFEVAELVRLSETDFMFCKSGIRGNHNQAILLAMIIINECFKNESNSLPRLFGAVIDVFWQSLNNLALISG